MNLQKYFLIILSFCIFQNITAEEIRVGLEPLPPLIISKTSGLSIQL